eukprot:scaffold10099_cov23-Cyclotella_meneghiniana.AAC.2
MNNEEDMSFRKSENVQESRWNLNYLAPPGSWLVTMVCHLEMKTTMKSFIISSSASMSDNVAMGSIGYDVHKGKSWQIEKAVSLEASKEVLRQPQQKSAINIKADPNEFY